VVPFVRKYDQDGIEAWSRQLAPVSFTTTGIAVDGTGIYVLGTAPSGDAPGPFSTFLRKYSVDGDELWTQTRAEEARAVAAGGSGVYLHGRSYGNFTSVQDGGFLRKYDSSGKELWSKPAMLGAFLAADGSGVYLAGTPGIGSSQRSSVTRYTTDGAELWRREVVTTDESRPVRLWQEAFATAVAADATGVYVVGRTYLSDLPGQCRSGTGGDAFVRKYDPDGAESWTRQFANQYSATADGVAANAGGVYVIGRRADDPTPAGAVFPWYPTSRRISAFLAKFEKAAEVVGLRPRITPGCVVNAASYIGGGVAPGEMVEILGSGIGPPELVRSPVSDGFVSATLAGTRILFNGMPASLLFVSDKKSSAVVPYGVAGRTTVEVQVEYQGVLSDAVTVPVLASRPGIFSRDGSGHGQGSILNEDGSVNSRSNPAERGSVVTIYLTGGGESAAGVVSLPVAAAFDVGSEDWTGATGEVLYAGAVPGDLTGLLQVNVRVPSTAVDGGAVGFGLCIGSQCVQEYQVSIALR
jgi:uncharacterized protein (TIGR03437 family)